VYCGDMKVLQNHAQIRERPGSHGSISDCDSE
jgi:hypothetical protein